MKKLTIILITDFSRPWNNGWYYKAGFEKNGHEVITFDSSSVKDPSKRVVGLVRQSKPDFILHTKDELPPGIFQDLRQLTKVVQWYPDPVVPEWLPAYVQAADIFFTMSEGLIGEFRRLGAERVFWLTQAFEPSFFQIRQVSDEDVRRYSAEVAFVGNLGSKIQYIPRRRYLEHILQGGIHLKWWGPEIPRKITAIPLIAGKIGRAYGGAFVWGEEYAKVAKLSKIFLAIDSRPDVRKSMSARMYTAVGCGAFYLCLHVKGIEDVLIPGKEIITFRSEDEMMDMIRYYLENDEQRRVIAEAGRKRVMQEHTYEVRAREMIAIIEENI
jgi:spore maturation protein CgeB